MKGFMIAGGSVPGTYHTRPGQPGWGNNQDAFDFYETDDYLVAVVSDGCGSTPHAEVGSKLTVRFLMNVLVKALDKGLPHDAQNVEVFLNGPLLQDLEVLLTFTSWAMSTHGNRETILLNYFFATVVGVIITPQVACVFSFGDGVYSLNGDLQTIPPATGNAPPYIGQRLIPGLMDDKYLKFRVQALLPTTDVQSVTIGTDGVEYFREVEDRLLPNKQELVGPLSQFWENRRFVDNPDAIRRRLAMANMDTVEYELDAEGRLINGPRIKPGLLYDDTTLVVIQHNKPTEE